MCYMPKAEAGDVKTEEDLRASSIRPAVRIDAGRETARAAQAASPFHICGPNSSCDMDCTERSEWDEWDVYEEDGPMDLEDQLDAAFARAGQSR